MRSENGHVANFTPTKKGWPDVYVNGEDGIVTVDPLKNDMWIVDNSMRHWYANYRGQLKDHAGVTRVLHQIEQHPLPARTYTEKQMKHRIDNSLKFSTRCNSQKGACNPAAGMLPRLMADNYYSTDYIAVK